MKEKLKNKQTTDKHRKEQRVETNYSERVRAKWFCCGFNLGFLQLIYEASVIFESNLESAWQLF